MWRLTWWEIGFLALIVLWLVVHQVRLARERQRNEQLRADLKKELRELEAKQARKDAI